jgi:hypothetical protein
VDAKARDPGFLDQAISDLHPAPLARTLAGAKLDCDRQPTPARSGASERHRSVWIVEERSAGTGLAHLRHRTAHVQVDQVRAGRSDPLGRGGHHLRIVAEQLNRNRVLIRVDPQQLATGALIPVVDREARHHLGDGQSRSVALRLQAHEPVPDPGERREHDAVGDLHAAQLPGIGQRPRLRGGLLTFCEYLGHGFMVSIRPWMLACSSARGRRS